MGELAPPGLRPGGIFLPTKSSRRKKHAVRAAAKATEKAEPSRKCIAFLVDGFNVYHSIKDAQVDGHGCAKWLDLASLCNSFLSSIGDVKLVGIYYFSALAIHKEPTNPGIAERHQRLIDCMRSRGVDIVLSKFKTKLKTCLGCGVQWTEGLEKETDVAIASKVMELLHRDECDILVLVTGDSDYAPAVSTAHRLFPMKEICFLFPYKRKSKELAKMGRSWKITPDRYAKHQLPDRCRVAPATYVDKPVNWV